MAPLAIPPSHIWAGILRRPWGKGRCQALCGSSGAALWHQDEKQSPQHSMQISRQSADSQQASTMPQSRSQGRSQSAHSPEPQQQQQRQESSELQEPHVAQSRTMLQSVRNSQNRQDRMQCTQQSVGGGRPVRDRSKAAPVPTVQFHLVSVAPIALRSKRS